MPRIAVGGFQHETNTFAPSKATFERFAEADGWPGLTRGAAIFETFSGFNIPLAGFLDAPEVRQWDLRPLVWASATPSDRVTEEAFERITAMILADLTAAQPLDGLYLDLHGAMVTARHQDGEGELLRRVRALVGPELPIVVSLDLHANVTPEMAALADRLVIYRTYPHIDMAETGARAARELARLLAGARRGQSLFRQLPFLIPLTAGCTFMGPAKAVYETLTDLEVLAGEGAHLSFACGFCPADIHHCGPALVAYGPNAEGVAASAAGLFEEITGREREFQTPLWSPEAAVAHALRETARGRRPIVLADAQDNPGAGGESDTTWLLAELVRQGAENAVLGLLYDPEAALAAHAAGLGAEITLSLGAKSGQAGHRPFEATFKVAALGDGRITATGPFFDGARMTLGPMALLSLGGVGVAVASRQEQAADQAMFRHLGVEPAETAILVLKSSVHFRADFDPLAAETLVVAAPGPCTLDNRKLVYKNLRDTVRIMPLEN